MSMINCIVLVLLLLVSMVLLKCTNSRLVIHFLKFVRVFHLQVLLIIIFPISFVIFFHVHFLMITIGKVLFSLVSQIKNENLSKTCFDSSDLTSLFVNIPLQETIDIAKNIIFNYNPNLKITRKELQKTFPFRYITDSFYF